MRVEEDITFWIRSPEIRIFFEFPLPDALYSSRYSPLSLIMAFLCFWCCLTSITCVMPTAGHRIS